MSQLANSDIAERLFPTETCPLGKSALEWIQDHNSKALIYPTSPQDRKFGYLFRGELGCYKALQSTLEREFFNDSKKLPISSRKTAVSGHELNNAESLLYDNFLKNGAKAIADGLAAHFDAFAKAHLSTSQLSHLHTLISPPPHDVFSWVSYMRHYRHPVRFVDFTRDLHVAVYFCLEQLKSHPDTEFTYIYCFPCWDCDPDDTHSNKTPFKTEPTLTPPAPNMNDALGYVIGMPWAQGTNYRMRYSTANRRQSWGWDRPYFQNPRLWHQEGMFVYPFDYPEVDLTREGSSWLIQNLSNTCKGSYPLKVVTPTSTLAAKRLKIPTSAKAELESFLQQKPNMSEAVVYLDLEKVDLAK